MTRVFLSYTASDSRVTLRVVEGLRAAGAEVFYYEDESSRGQQVVRLLEDEVNRADLFVALMSPTYLDSYWCRRERDLAMMRESELRRQFIYVFHVVETSHADAGFLRTVDWIDLRAPVNQAKLRLAVARLALDQQRPASVAQLDGRPLPRFHNRRDEIERVVNALTTAGGQDLWLVLAPPRMGKSWFLQRMGFELKQKDEKCLSRLVDLRAFPELGSDWTRLLCTLLNVEPPGSAVLTPDDEVRVATQVSRRSCLQFCMLDSAELMTPECVDGFRRAVTLIYQHMERMGNPRSRLSIMVASRHQREWKGYGRMGRSRLFATLPLTEFGIPVVKQAVSELGRQFSGNELDKWAASLHALSEGLPALLAEGLRWAQGHEFLLESADETAFATVANPYITQDLLTTESLLPLDDAHSTQRKDVLERALRAIVPYRLFTQSHLKYHLAGDPDFDRTLAAAEWSFDQLWEALGRTALVKEPSDETWHVLNPPIRRLLYRYYYPDSAARVRANLTARRFYEGWADRFDSTEQVVALAECLWHEATMIAYERPDELSTLLPIRAAELARIFARPSSCTRTELRGLVFARVRDDTDLVKLMSPHGRLVENVLVSIGETISEGLDGTMLSLGAIYIPRAEAELIRAQVDRVCSDQSSRIVLLSGAGGAGKTTLVRALANEEYGYPTVRWIPPVDIDDSNFWLLENLQRLLAERLDPSRRYFEPFLEYLARLPKYVAGRLGRDTLASHHNRIREAFVDCYRRFVLETGSSVVITLDTVETIRSTYLLLSLTQLMKALPCTLFVLAGRPTRGRQDQDTIHEYVADPQMRLETILVELGGFQPDDALAFLNASVLGSALDTGDKRRLIELTDGHPLWLTLAVDYLRQSGPPPEMTDRSVPQERVREAFRRRLVTPYRSTEFWPEAIKRLAVVRHSVDQQVWRMLMDDRDLPPGTADWDEAWLQLKERPWIRPRANDRYITLHDALAEELALRVIPMHDQDETWRSGLWVKAARAYDILVGTGPSMVRQQLAAILDEDAEPDDTALRRVRELDTRKRELDQLRTARLHYLLLSDFQQGIDQFAEQFTEAASQDDLQFQELVCHELERFLPPIGETRPRHDAVGVVVDRFHAWLIDQPGRYVRVGLNIARFLIQNSQPRAALRLLDRLPMDGTEAELCYRLDNERGNAWMRVPGEVRKARQYFDMARQRAARLDPPLRERRLAQAFKELGFYSRNLGNWRDADIQYARASELIGSIVGPGWPDSHREELASIQTNWAYLKALQGQYEEARGLIDSAMGTRRKLGHDQGIAVSLSAAGEVHRYERQFEHAWDFYQKAEALFVRLGNWPWVGLVLQEQAICLFQARDAGHQLVDEPVDQSKVLITRAMDICRDQAVRWYPSALNRAGRIFGRDDPDLGLDYLSIAIDEARRVADGWFLSASLIEYLELCYRAWTQTEDPHYRELVDLRMNEVDEVLAEYRFPDFKGRWDLLRGHLAVQDYLVNDRTEALPVAVRCYSDGFRILADRKVGSYRLAALASEFDKVHDLFRQLPPTVQVEWYKTLRSDWSKLASDDRSTLLLAQLERLY